MGIRDDWRRTKERSERQQDPVRFAQAAWDDGQLCFLTRLMPSAFADETELNATLDQILRIGWDLRSASVAHRPPGAETLLFVFVRPK